MEQVKQRKSDLLVLAWGEREREIGDSKAFGPEQLERQVSLTEITRGTEGVSRSA